MPHADGTPPVIFHIAQTCNKVVRVKPDALDRYNQEWKDVEDVDDSMRRTAGTLLKVILGKECRVLNSVYLDKKIYYQLPIVPIVNIPDVLGHPVRYNRLLVSGDYVEILAHGFCEAS